MADWKVQARPSPEFHGYCWHIPATDPTQYQIELLPEHGDPQMPVWVLWPSGDVYLWYPLHDDFIHIGMVKEMEEDGEPHSWMFEGPTDSEMYDISRDISKDLAAYIELITEELDTIVTDSVHDWPTE